MNKTAEQIKKEQEEYGKEKIQPNEIKVTPIGSVKMSQGLYQRKAVQISFTVHKENIKFISDFLVHATQKTRKSYNFSKLMRIILDFAQREQEFLYEYFDEKAENDDQ